MNSDSVGNQDGTMKSFRYSDYEGSKGSNSRENRPAAQVSLEGLKEGLNAKADLRSARLDMNPEVEVDREKRQNRARNKFN